MKVRSGFVSNSSSSSFIVYGIRLTDEMVDTLEEKFDIDDRWDLMEKVEEDTNLDLFRGENSEEWQAIGECVMSAYNESVSELKEISSETKETVKQKLKELGFDDEPKCYLIGC